MVIPEFGRLCANVAIIRVDECADLVEIYLMLFAGGREGTIFFKSSASPRE